MRNIILLLSGLILFTGVGVGAESGPAPLTNPFPVFIRVDAGKTTGELKPIWRFFGADEPNYAYMKNGKKLIG